MSICICTGNGRERLRMVMGVFKMSRSELNMSGNERWWVGVGVGGSTV